MDKRQRNIFIQVAVGAAIVAVYFYLSQSNQPPVVLNGTPVNKAVHLDQYQLVDIDNKPVTLGKFAGQWVVLFFGYTHCPDVCPTTLAYLKREYDELRELRKYLQVVMVSVDSKRDSPADLKAYVTGFDPDFYGVTGDETALNAMTKSFGGFYHLHKVDSAIEYTVEHPGDVFVISPDGEWISVYRPPLKNGVLVDDLRKLILKHNT